MKIEVDFFDCTFDNERPNFIYQSFYTHKTWYSKEQTLKIGYNITKYNEYKTVSSAEIGVWHIKWKR